MKTTYKNYIFLFFLLVSVSLSGCLSEGGDGGDAAPSAAQKSIVITGNIIPAGSGSAASPSKQTTAGGGDDYIVTITGIDDESATIGSAVLVNASFTASVPLSETVRYALINVKERFAGRTLYKNLLGRVPEASEISGNIITVKNVTVNDYSTARTLLALENKNAVPAVPIALDNIELDQNDASKSKTEFEKTLESKLGPANISELKKAVEILSRAISDTELKASLNFSGNDNCRTVVKNFIDILKISAGGDSKLGPIASQKIRQIISDAKVDVSQGIMVNGDIINKDSVSASINHPPVISNVSVIPGFENIVVNYDLFDADSDKCSVEVFLVLDSLETAIGAQYLSGDISEVTSGANKTITWKISSADNLSKFNNYKIKLCPSDAKTIGVSEYSRLFSAPAETGHKLVVSNITLQSSEISGDTVINYNLYAENNHLCDIKVYFSIDYAGTTEITAGLTGDIKNVSPGTRKSIGWQSRNDLSGYIKNVRIIISPNDSENNGIESISPLFNVNNPVAFTKTFEYSASPDILPDKRYYHAAVVDSGNKMWIAGGMNESGKTLDDFWTFDAEVNKWTRITPSDDDTAENYAARESHSMSIDSENRIWIVGGRIDGAPTDDIWQIDTASSSRKKITATGEAFSARYGHSASIDAGGMLWSVGGKTGGTVSCEIWRLDTKILEWKKITAGGGAFTPRYRHASVIDSTGKIWCFGGLDSSDKSLDEIWRFDTAGLSWQKVAATGEKFETGAYQTCVMGPGGKIYIIGGKSDVNDGRGNNNFFCFDTSSYSLTRINPQSDIFESRYALISVIDSKNKIYVMGGRSINVFNDTWYSEDFCRSWKNPGIDHIRPCPRYNHSSVISDSGRIFIIGGIGNFGNYLNDVWYSDDSGAAWVEANKDTPYDKKFTARYGHSSFIYQGKIYVTGGGDNTGVLNDVLCSSDNGATWADITKDTPEKKKFSARARHSSVVNSSGKMWVMGGVRYIFDNSNAYEYNDAWVSEDLGATWALVNPNLQTILKSPAASGQAEIVYPSFPPTSDHTSVIDKNGRIYVIGGSSPQTWYSDDGGVKWRKFNVSTPEFSMRYGHSSVVDSKGRTFVIGGSDQIRTPVNDVWYTADFSNWIMAAKMPGISARTGHSSVIDKNGRIYIIGGKNSKSEAVNDMCYYFEP